VSTVLPTTAPKLRRCPRQRQRMIVGRGWWLGAALPQHCPESGLNWTASRAQDHRPRESQRGLVRGRSFLIMGALGVPMSTGP
jgi:hypothetical protein